MKSPMHVEGGPSGVSENTGLAAAVVRSPVWVFDTLSRKHRVKDPKKRCHVRIPDTVIYDPQTGSPVTWILNSSSGHIIRKKSVAIKLEECAAGSSGLLESPNSKPNVSLPGVKPGNFNGMASPASEPMSADNKSMNKIGVDIPKLRNRIIKMALERQEKNLGNARENFKQFASEQQVDDEELEMNTLNLGNGTRSFRQRKRQNRLGMSQFSNVIVAVARRLAVDGSNNTVYYPEYLRIWDFLDTMNASLSPSTSNVSLNGLVTLQAIVLNNNPVVHGRPAEAEHLCSSYMNHYTGHNESTSSIGRVATATFKFLSPKTGQANSGKMIRSKATAINQMLDDVTLKVVKYIEHTQKVHIATISCEYVVDTDQVPWLVWCSDITTTSPITSSMTSGEELSSVHLSSSDWSQTQTTFSSSLTKPSASHDLCDASVATSLGHVSQHGLIPGEKASNDRNKARNKNQTLSGDVERMAMGVQVGSAVNNLDTLARANDEPFVTSETKQHFSLRSKHTTTALQSNFRIGIRPDSQLQKETVHRKRFRCAGDFCDFRVEDPEGFSEVKTIPAVEAARQLFSKEELAALAEKVNIDVYGTKDISEDQTSSSSKTGTQNQEHQSHYLNYKSIVLARNEKRSIVQNLSQQQIYDFDGNMDTLIVEQAAKNTEMSPESTFESNKRIHEDVGVGNYYKQVRVCSNCFKMYSTLDRARETLDNEKRAMSSSSNNTTSRESTPSKWLGQTTYDPDRPPSANTLARIQRRQERRAQVSSAQGTKSKKHRVVKTPPITTPRTVKARNQVRQKVKNLQDAVGGRTALPKMDRMGARALAQKKGIQTLGDLEGYLRGNGAKEEQDKSENNDTSTSESIVPVSEVSNPQNVNEMNKTSSGYCGKVLVVEPDLEVAKYVEQILTEAYFVCTIVQNGEQALEIAQSQYFDLMLLTRDLEGTSGIEVCKLFRKFEKKLPRDHRRLPIVAFTEAAEPSDLRLYMEVGMDGCVSKPVDQASLLNTMGAAIPHHKPDTEHYLLKKRKQLHGENDDSTKAQQLVSNGGGFGLRNPNGKLQKLRPQTTGLVTASEVAKLTLPVSIKDVDNEATHGVFQLDADTSLPYCVLGKRRLDSPMFNFVVVHDFFDTYETMEIFFKPIVAKYPGLQVLLFNTPGQAHTEWRKDAVLNNEYLADCLEAMLRYVDYNGTGEFHTRGPYGSPFYMMGFGNGANVVTCHTVVHKHSNLRASVLINSFSHVDAHLAGVLHDCMNVFSCSPSTRPDLPIYFYSRFIFSSSYLTRVTTPLALNLYTAVHNPITLQGRMQICKGALAHLDLRPLLKEEHSHPMIMVQSAQGGLVKPHHVEPYIQSRGGTVESVRRALKDRSRPCLVWMKAGHELFQECRRPLLHLFEQLATGYHEKHDVVFLPHSNDVGDAGSASMGPKGTLAGRGIESHSNSRQPPEYFEDRFINNVLGSVRETAKPNNTILSMTGSSIATGNMDESRDLSQYLPMESTNSNVTSKSYTGWAEHQVKIQSKTSSLQQAGPSQGKKGKSKKGGARSRHVKGSATVGGVFSSLTLNEEPVTDLNPLSKSFNRSVPKNVAQLSSNAMLNNNGLGSPSNSQSIGNLESGLNVSMTSDVPEVREYMRWRIARNRKRLAKLEEASRVLQRSWRAFVARTLMMRLRMAKAALAIQRQWRAKKGRDALGSRKKEDWAARLLQRQFRGRHGRLKFQERQEQQKAAQDLQRLFRGRLGKKRVDSIKNARIRSAKLIQKIFRGHKARGTTWRKRRERNAATEIQRVFRGWVGRSRAILEREKFLFSKAQSQGIDFGRQMLLEHKLHGTRLQSEVSLLTKEKVETEEKVEALLGEIAEFDDGVVALEREMHELSKVETEAKGILDEEAKMELREQKMRLDREFGVMLGKIGDRKERLRALEIKLQTIDRSRQGKEEELRDLERKLVVLLEEQQQELEQIKQRQEKRGELVVSDNIVAVGSGTKGEGASFNANGKPIDAENLGDGVGPRSYTGPTPLQQEQANSLMQSTESLMKFGFMSMSLTYFSSLNMVRAMRKIGAVNTIMNGTGGSLEKLLEGVEKSSGDVFQPKLRKGEMPGQEKVTLAVWSVADVGDWLESLSLGHYRGCFEDAAIDGSFLCDLNDDDLRNTLGIEHNLHRKKLLNSIQRLRYAEQVRAQGKSGALVTAPQLAIGAAPMMQMPAMVEMQNSVMPTMNTMSPTIEPIPAKAVPTGTPNLPGAAPGAALRLDKLITIVRHGKTKELKNVLGSLPDRQFDTKDVAQAYVEGFGTQYTEEVNREAWHINKPDEYGNSLLTIACQNGHQKIATYLVQKSANPNHQNNQGQTPLHYAMTYNFFDLGAWLTDTEKGAGADDSITNMYGLTPYDGLALE